MAPTFIENPAAAPSLPAESTVTPLDPTKIDSPFTAGALEAGSSIPFWTSYIAARPSPPESFFSQIYAYHRGQASIAHDVGTGPGNIARRLLPYFEHVVCSDINASVLAVAPTLLESQTDLSRLTHVVSGAEALADEGVIPGSVGVGRTDLVCAGECMPLLDTPRALTAFHSLLRTGGTLAIYFYGRVIVADGGNSELCNQTFDRLATMMYQLFQPIKGTPGHPFHSRSGEMLLNSMDNLEVDGDLWGDVKRFKWNADYPLLFAPEASYDFEIKRVDRRKKGEQNIEVIDRDAWAHEWAAEDVFKFLDSIYLGWRGKAGEKSNEVDAIVKELDAAMGGGKRKVTFPVSLILATKK